LNVAQASPRRVIRVARGAHAAGMETTRTDSDKKSKDATLIERPSRAVASDASTARKGLVPSLFGLGIDVSEDTITGVIGLADDVRRETRTAFSATLDFADSLSKAVVGLGRRTVERVDRIVADVLGGSERLVTGSFTGLRQITDSASALADQATRSVVGGRDDRASA
jgi:hypothetical protein